MSSRKIVVWTKTTVYDELHFLAAVELCACSLTFNLKYCLESAAKKVLVVLSSTATDDQNVSGIDFTAKKLKDMRELVCASDNNSIVIQIEPNVVQCLWNSMCLV